jgi:SAM-dependent methyltransferase
MSRRQPPDPGTGAALPSDYDTDPGRFAAAQAATQRFSARGDVHPLIAHRLAAAGCRTVLDIGGGTGTLARLLTGHGIRTVVADHASHITRAPRPAIRTDAVRLPFPAGTFDGAAALFMLYHLANPVLALQEARRVLRPHGLLAVSTVSRHSDPELAPVLPRLGKPLSFDAENGPGLLRSIFGAVAIQHWDDPLIHIPDRDALTLYLRGRGLPAQRARAAAQQLQTPIIITKRGMIGWIRMPRQPTPFRTSRSLVGVLVGRAPRGSISPRERVA